MVKDAVWVLSAGIEELPEVDELFLVVLCFILDVNGWECRW